MNGIVSRLQVFLAKIAGKDVDVSTLTPPVAINEEERLMLDIADRIDAIESGDGLPAVTSEDNGDVLTVVNGAWDKAAPSGGSEIFEAVFEVDWDTDTSSYVVTGHQTIADIVAAAVAGKTIIGSALFWSTNPYRKTMDVTVSAELGTASFYFDFIDGDAVSNMVLAHADIYWDANSSAWIPNNVCWFTLTPGE